MTWKAGAYPESRDRPHVNPPTAVPRYGRMDGPSSATTVGDTDATVWTFSGRPDKIILSARANPVLFTLTDRLNRETTVILVPTDSSVPVELARERVLARNAVPGSVAVCGVVGLWGESDEPSSQRESSS